MGRKMRHLGVVEIARAIVELPGSLGSKIGAVECATVLAALEACEENQSAAARLLGIDRKAYVRKLRRARRALRQGPGASAR